MPASDKRSPWFKWYPADWRADPRLRMCSLAARGLWIELLGYMHESPRYGYLLIGDVAPSVKQIATLVGDTAVLVKQCMQELEVAGVYSVDEGVVYSRRMKRDKAKADADRENGSIGGNPKLRQRENQTPPIRDNGGVNPQPNRGDNGGDKAAYGHAPATYIPEARSQKEEPPGERTESPPRAQRAPPAEGFAFRGTVIRLTQPDLDRWKASYSAIPDLTAELETIDAKLVDEGFEGKWFGKVSAWLRTRHEALLRQNPAPPTVQRQAEDREAADRIWHGIIAEFVKTRDEVGGHWEGRGYWREGKGLPPGQSGCQAPRHLLAKFGLLIEAAE